jgi:hypothetical protein
VALVVFVTQIGPLLRVGRHQSTTECGTVPRLTDAGASAGPRRPPE